jgi:hypothetical protein
VLVTSQTYNSAGWVATITDPRGIEGRLFYDNLGRTTKTIEAYVDGTPDTNSDRTTEFTYDGSGHMLTLKSHLTSGAYQTTQFVYGVTTGGGSAVNSNDLLAEMRYPDKSSGDPAARRTRTTPTTRWASPSPAKTATATSTRIRSTWLAG